MKNKSRYGLVIFRKNGSCKRTNPNKLYQKPYFGFTLKEYSDPANAVHDKNVRLNNNFRYRCAHGYHLGFFDQSRIVSHVLKNKRKDIKLSNW